jgi:tRNA(Ile)-lysidine synthase
MCETMTNQVIAKLHDCIERRGFIGAGLVVAVSGGPDSLALTLALADLREALDLHLHLAHLDHQLRPESADDAAFVQDIARSLRLPLTVGHVNVRQSAETEGVGIEEAARRERYRFLARLCRTTGATGVVVAHTADDQTETRLMHWLRGSGLRGLVGMAEDALVEVPGAGLVRIVRPLLDVRKEETEAFCRERGVTARFDPSNLDRTFTRNRLRHDVLPSLREINSRLDDSLARLARCAADAEQFIESELDRRIGTLVRIDGSDWVIDRKRWRELPPALKRALLQRAATAVGHSTTVVDADNVEEGLRAADNWPSGKALTWPSDIELRVEHDRVMVRRRRVPGAALPTYALSIADDGEVVFGPIATSIADDPQKGDSLVDLRGIIRWRRVTAPCTDRRADQWHCDLDGAKIAEVSSLVLRSRQPGDWIMPEGMTGRKKIQDLLVDAHIPREERQRVPIIASAKGIAWVAGVRRDRRFVADAESHDVVCLEIEAESTNADRSVDPRLVDPRKEIVCAT